MTKLLKLHLPEYAAESPPKSDDIGRLLDHFLTDNFASKTIVLRGVALHDHPDVNLEDLVHKIEQYGTDKYDQKRKGVGGRAVPLEHRDNFTYGDIFDLSKIGKSGTGRLTHNLYYSAISDRGYPIRADVILVYDRSALKRLKNTYDGATETDMYAPRESFKDALLGIIKVL